jgi:hypothetical protein
MRSATDEAAVETWLRWFQTSRYGRCRAYLCATYGLEPADAEALMNTAALQVVAHWATLQTPLAYFWTTLRRAVQQHRGAVARDQQRRAAYARQQHCHARLAAGTARQVADLLAAVPPASANSSSGLCKAMMMRRWPRNSTRLRTPCDKHGMRPMSRCGTGSPGDSVCRSGGTRRTLAPVLCAAGGRAELGHHGSPTPGSVEAHSLADPLFFCPCLTFLPPARLSTGAGDAPWGRTWVCDCVAHVDFRGEIRPSTPSHAMPSGSPRLGWGVLDPRH